MSNLKPEIHESIDDLMHGRDDIENLAWWPTFFVRVMSGILVIVFTWLQFRSYAITQLIENAEPQAFLRFIMFGFFLSWVLGPSFDVKIQKAVYAGDPHHGAITPTGLTLLVLFSLGAILMLWATLNEKIFFVALTGFIILNVIGYIFIYLRMRTIVRSSGMRFQSNKNLFLFVRLHFVTEFMFGAWQRYRFLFMILSVALLDVLCFVTPLRSFVSGLAHQLLPINQNTIFSLLPDLGLMCFFVASEGWIWTQRLKVSVALETINTLSRNYKLSLLSNS